MGRSNEASTFNLSVYEEPTMLNKFLVVCLKIVVINGFTCNEILNFGDDKRLSLAELQTTQPKHIVECLAHLGKQKIAMDEAEYIWQTLVNFYNGIENIPEKQLMLLHWVTPALRPDDLANLTLSNIDVIQNFGLNYQLSAEQLSALADGVRENFAGKEPEDFTFYDLTALRQILCAFNRSEIERIQPSAFREAAGVLAKLESCSIDVMIGFASLAVHRNAFGNPASWSESTVDAIGPIIKYLQKDLQNKITAKNVKTYLNKETSQ